MLGELEQVVMLAVLRLGGEAYGVPIRSEIAERSGRELTLAHGQWPRLRVGVMSRDAPTPPALALLLLRALLPASQKEFPAMLLVMECDHSP